MLPERQRARGVHAPLDEFTLLTRDIYIPPGKIGSQFGVSREADGGWALAVNRHWQLDRDDPR